MKRPSRRSTLLGVTGALLAAASLPVTAAQATAPPAASDPFPVTVEHKFGETTIDAAPERIVTVGLVEQDVLLALGVAPVATTEWFGDQPGAIFPWAMDELEALGAPIPDILGTADAVNFEAVAAQDPDLIVAIYGELNQTAYDRLSDIAPTIAQPAEYVDYGAPWDVTTRTIGQALGKSDEAEALIADIEAQFAAVREAHPEFQGATAHRRPRRTKASGCTHPRIRVAASSATSGSRCPTGSPRSPATSSAPTSVRSNRRCSTST